MTNADTPGSLRWTSLVGVGLHARLVRRAAQLRDRDTLTRTTAGVQRQQLRWLLGQGMRTEFGRGRRFADLLNRPDHALLDAYQKAIPIQDISAFRAPIERMREGGEPDVLWPGLVRDFAQTSGTTAGDKFIPVSKAMMRSNYLAALDIFASAINFGVSLPRLMGGRCLFLGGSSDVTANEHGIRTGDLSGLVTPLIRWPLSSIYAPGKQIALMDDWPAKIEAMARQALNLDIRMLNGMPSWTVVLLERVLELARERGPYETIRDVWPHLTLFAHGGVRYTPFEARVRELFSGSPEGDDLPNRVELYPASEGFVAIQDTKDDPGLRLLTDNKNFFEFVPLEEADRPDARAFACDQVEPGQRYVVCLTTCAGLWRYLLGDVVVFEDVCGGLDGSPGTGPARLRIVGRHKHFINAFGENLIVENIEMAAVDAAAAAGVGIGEFTAAPRYPEAGGSAGLDVAAEFLVEPKPEALEAFTSAFDASLQRQVVDYTVKRTSDLGMGPPKVFPLRPGAFHGWLHRRGKLGGQHKCPRCANHREYLDELTSDPGARWTPGEPAGV